jgi:CHAT domain-containing protein/Tfp pilus assembly protein PilF
MLVATLATRPNAALADGPPPKELSKVDAQRVTELYAKASTFGREGKFAEAQGPVQEILELCMRELGQDHAMTGDYRREIETLKKLAALSDADKLEYRKTYVLADEIKEVFKKGTYAAGLRPAEQILDIYRRLLGPDSWLAAIAANQYAELLVYNERFADAEKLYLEALRIAHAVVGENSKAVVALYGNLALNLEKQHRFAESLDLLEKALKIETRIYGEGHPETGVVLSNLGSYYDKQGLYSRSEELYRRSIKAIRSAENPNKDRLAVSCSNLALSLTNQDKFEEAETLFQESLKIRLELHGDDHPDTGRVYMNLGTNRQARGDIGDGEPYFRKAVDIYKKTYGRIHSETAWALNNLAVNLDNQGRYKEGEAYLDEALAIVMRSPAIQSVAIAKMTNNMASCLQGQERFEDAENLCEKALETLRKALGPGHTAVGVAANNVAANLAAQARYDEAERYLRDALTILRQNNGDSHSETAEGLDNLAVNLYHQGRFKDAERYFKEALNINQRVLGEGHPNTARTYKELIVNFCANGDYAEAAQVAAAATNSFETARRRISYAGLNRARRAAQFSPLPALAVVAARRDQPEVAWQALEQNLARGLIDDLADRPISPDERRREQALLERLEQLDRQVFALQADDKNHAAVDLRQQREAAQTEFTRYQADMAARYGVPVGEVYSLPRIQAQLPMDAALIAWVELYDQDKRVEPMGDHWACVVRHSGPPVWVRLRGTGENGAWTKDDERLIFRVRRYLANRPTEGDSLQSGLVQSLVAQRLGPLEKYFQATNELPAVRHLIVLPCPRMASIPLDALTDNYTVSHAPSGTMLAWLKEHRPKQAGADPNLFALADPEFMKRPDNVKADQPSGRREAFSRLAATQQELVGILRLFSDSRVLTKQNANKQLLDQIADSGELAKYRYLHFATHGVLDDQRPMHSALILAPDRNLDRRDREFLGPNAADGRLTAEHILRRWKLNADLVTLSACDTGLGEFSGGEGYPGFSQALFLKGARSLVLSLWQVDDNATALLMTRFYENLIGIPDSGVKPMTKADALAEAKKWLCTLGPQDVAQLTKGLKERGTRGRIVQRSASDNKAPRSFAHPYYWSGFILTGDPQ